MCVYLITLMLRVTSIIMHNKFSPCVHVKISKTLNVADMEIISEHCKASLRILSTLP